MGGSATCSKEGLNKGAWNSVEDEILISYIQTYGEGKWRCLARRAGLKRCGKSCRQRWLNYLRPDIKRGNISDDEADLIIRLHKLLGNRWSLMAGRLPGRTDNEIKNYWNKTFGKKVLSKSSESPKKKFRGKSKEKQPQAKPPATKAPPLPPGTETNIIRTKAFKCSEGFVHPSSLSINNAKCTEIKDRHILPQSHQGSSLIPYDTNNEEDPLEHLIIGDLSNPYQSNSNIMQVTSDQIQEKSNMTRAGDENINLSASSDHSILFQDAFIEDWIHDDGFQPYDFRPLASFSNFEDGW